MDRPRPAQAPGTRCDPRRKTRPSRDPLLWRPARPARADRPAHRMARHLWRVSSRGAYRTRARRRPFAADVIAAFDTPEQFFDEMLAAANAKRLEYRLPQLRSGEEPVEHPDYLQLRALARGRFRFIWNGATCPMH